MPRTRNKPSPPSTDLEQQNKAFLAKKQEILDALNLDEQEYDDKSPKGSVDIPIKPLLNQINGVPGLVTTSSCSGRVSVFVDGSSTKSKADEKEEDKMVQHLATRIKAERAAISSRQAQELTTDEMINEAAEKAVEVGLRQIDTKELTEGLAALFKHILFGLPEGQLDRLAAETTEKWAEEEGKGPQRQVTTNRAGGGGKGGGRWLYISHDPSESQWNRQGVLQVAEALNVSCHPSHPALQEATEQAVHYNGVTRTQLESINMIHFKFEPMILHILASSLDIAQRVLGAAQQAGFRESGISSATSETPVVAIRTNGLALESLVGMEVDGDLKGNVDFAYLELLFNIAEKRFTENKQRMDRLQESLSQAFTPSDTTASSNSGWEAAEARRQRKRREGLARQADLKRKQGVEDEGEASTEIDNLDLDSIVC